MRHFPNILLIAFFAISSAFASPLSYTSDYNVLVFGSLTATGSIGGSVAVGGSVAMSNISIAGANGAAQGATPPSGPDALNLIVGGSMSWSNGSLVNGNGVYQGAALINNVRSPGGSVNFGTVPVDFGELAHAAQTASAAFANLVANGEAKLQHGGLVLSGSSTELNVFEISGSDLGGINWMNIQVPDRSTVLINITGTNGGISSAGISLNGRDFNHNQNADAWGEVLWNFSGAGAFSMANVKFGGTLLAPNASVTLTHGQVNGQIVARNLTTNGAIHNFSFAGTKPTLVGPPAGDVSDLAPVPEPGTYLLTACGLLLIAVRTRRRAKQQVTI